MVFRSLLTAALVGLLSLVVVGCASSGGPSAYEISGCRVGPGATCPGADLIGADMAGLDLRRADFAKASLRGADLTGADLTGADLRGTELVEANLTGANLTGANLASADLSSADLRGARLDSTDLTGTLRCKSTDPAGNIVVAGCVNDRAILALGALRNLSLPAPRIVTFEIPPGARCQQAATGPQIPVSYAFENVVAAGFQVDSFLVSSTNAQSPARATVGLPFLCDGKVHHITVVASGNPLLAPATRALDYAAPIS